MHTGGVGGGYVCARTIDEVKALAGIVLIQAHFEIGRVRIVGKAHRVPLDVKDPIGRSAGNRGEDTAAVGPCAAPAETDVGAHIMP